MPSSFGNQSIEPVKTSVRDAASPFAGAKYSVPKSGWIELLAEREDKGYLAANGRTLPLDVWPIDAFGTRTVPLQETAAPQTHVDTEPIRTINN